MGLENILPVFSVALIISIINVIHIIIGYAQTAPGLKYFAIGNYYLDYFVYLQVIAQGMRGHYLVDNPFATDDPTRTFLVWWPYLIIGKIANFFHLSAIAGFWMSMIIFSLLFIILAYIVISKILRGESLIVRILTLLAAFFATPFIQKNLLPYDYWYSTSNLFKRLETVPHHLLGSVLVLAAILIGSSMLEKIKQSDYKNIIKSSFTIGAIVVVIMTFYPYNAINFIIALLITGIFITKPRPLLFFFIFILIVLPAGLAIKYLSQMSGTIVRTSQADLKYVYYPSVSLIFMTTGPILVLAILGLKDFFKRMTYLKTILLIFVITSHVFAFSKLSLYFGNFNLRFISPISYILYGILAIFGIKKIAGYCRRYKKYFFAGLIIIIMSYFFWYTRIYFQFYMTDGNQFPYIAYLPQGVVKGYEFLNTYSDKKAVLTSPSQFLGTVLPIFANRKVFIARQAFTPDYEKKAAIANQFYFGKMEQNEALNFLQKNNIGYVVLTSIEGYSVEPLLKYPFLQEVYKNKDIVIFKTL